jgi:hypothetical protein
MLVLEFKRILVIKKQKMLSPNKRIKLKIFIVNKWLRCLKTLENLQEEFKE